MTSFILWSGGKESYLSLLKARKRGFDVRFALSYVERRTRRLIGCHIREEVIREQVSRIGLEFVPVYGSRRKGDFLKNLRDTLISLEGIEAGVFGDISSIEHRFMVERECRDLGIRPIFPLWWVDELTAVKEAVSVCDPLVICRRIGLVKRRTLGKVLTLDVAKELFDKGLSPSGERGEYQTLVVRGEDFSLKVGWDRTFRRSYYECIDIKLER